MSEDLATTPETSDNTQQPAFEQPESTPTPQPRLVKRSVTPEPEEKVGAYFINPKKANLEFVRSGCCLLDYAIGGGWPLGRMSNIVGDKSTGKTLLAIEACTNFHIQYPRGKIYYLESEAAFDEGYAAALGMPLEAITFVGGDFKDFTIESWFEHLEGVIKSAGKANNPTLYIVDSLDALSDRAELDRKIDEGSYGGNKPKKVGELFRRLTKEIERTRLHLMIISQVRDNIGVMFGEKHTRTGGRAMDFYASQVVWLAMVKKLDKTIRKQKRVIGVEIKAQCKKNKIGLPYREAKFPVLFGYGIDDITAMLDWLKEIDALDSASIPGITIRGSVADIATSIKEAGRQQLQVARRRLEQLVLDNWMDIEDNFIPKSSKY